MVLVHGPSATLLSSKVRRARNEPAINATYQLTPP
jgi:hypothetical protein